MSDIKYIDPAEFHRLGLLQEANRLFFHPLGLALEMVTDETGDMTAFGGVWDYREDPEGMIFAELTDDEQAKASYVSELRRAHFEARVALFGVPLEVANAVRDADVQPLKWKAQQ